MGPIFAWSTTRATDPASQAILGPAFGGVVGIWLLGAMVASLLRLPMGNWEKSWRAATVIGLLVTLGALVKGHWLLGGGGLVGCLVLGVIARDCRD